MVREDGGRWGGRVPCIPSLDVCGHGLGSEARDQDHSNCSSGRDGGVWGENVCKWMSVGHGYVCVYVCVCMCVCVYVCVCLFVCVCV